MRRNGVWILWLSLLLIVPTLAYAQFGGGRRYRNLPQESATAHYETLNAVYASARNATVRIEITPSGVGSGFVISEDGLVITAYHVVRAARALNVITSGGDRYSATLVGYDEYGDVALLDIEAHNLPALPIDFTDTPEPGDALLAVGNSRGEFNAPRVGRVVALGQELSASFPSGLIATTMPLAPGDSGGPVLDADGEVVGIAVAVSVGPDGFSSFATPLFGSEASDFVAALEGGLQRGVPFMGVSLLELTPQAVAELGYGQPGGLLVTKVAPGSGADLAGLHNPDTFQTRIGGARGRFGVVTGIRSADIIVAVDGRRVAAADDLVGYLRGLTVGETVNLTVLRNGERLQVPVTLGTRSL